VNDRKLLVVDDEPLIMENLVDLFESKSWVVCSANSALEGLKKISSFKPSVIISDINMPEMSGLDLLAHLDALGSLTPLILLTGYRDIDKMQKAWEKSVFDFLDKPYKSEHIINVVESALEYGNDYVASARRRFARIKKTA
jgi:DNA-binding NtrC family response regulator